MLFKRIASCKINIQDPNAYLNFIDSLEIRDLRIAFNVQKYQSFSCNTSSVRIWNLRPENRNKIVTWGDQLILNAGYEKDAGEIQIFKGRTTNVTHKFSQPDVISTFDCLTGENYTITKQITLQMDESASLEQIIKKIALLAGFTENQIEIRTEIPTFSYNKGYSSSGTVKFMLDDICNKASTIKDKGISWTVLDDRLVILPRFAAADGNTIQINENTGLIGYPEKFMYRSRWLAGGGIKPGFRVSVALMPYLEPGQRIRLKSRVPAIDGIFSAITVTHSGDTHSENWVTDIELAEVGET